MPTVTLGGLTLRGDITCYDWADLFKTSKRGANRPIPGTAGRAVRVRVTDEVRAGLAIRIIGATHDDVYTHLATLQTVCAVNGPQDLTFVWAGGSVTVACVVEEMGPPTFLAPQVATLVVDVTLPDGPLDLTPPT
jgi:hypothetical protein